MVFWAMEGMNWNKYKIKPIFERKPFYSAVVWLVKTHFFVIELPSIVFKILINTCISQVIYFVLFT